MSFFSHHSAFIIQLWFCAAFALVSAPSTSVHAGPLDELEDAWLRAIERVQPSAVQVTVNFRGLGVGDALPLPPPLPRSSFSLSGVVYDPAGRVVTVGRALAMASSAEIAVPGREPVRARVLGVDPVTGIAVLEPTEHAELEPAVFQDRREVRPGSLVAILGNPYGLDRSVVYGNVAGVGRRVSRWPSIGMLQLSAAINPGDQGAPVANVRGEVIGVVASEVFAIPAGEVRRVADRLIAESERSRPWLGVRVGFERPGEGVVVTGVVPGGPASVAGVQEGDRILGLDGRDVASLMDLLDALQAAGPGREVSLDLGRGGQRLSLQVVPKAKGKNR